MKYALLIYSDKAAGANITPDQMNKMFAAYDSYTTAIKKSGAYLGGEPLQPTSTATTIRGSGGKARVVDGPFAETKESLGGFYLIDVPDLDAAIKWARSCPGTEYGSVEVRPVMPMPG